MAGCLTRDFTLPTNSMVKYAILMISLLTCVHFGTISGQADVMNPKTVSDSETGNSADENSTITWGPLPAGTPLKTSATADAEEGGLQALMDMTRLFVSLIAPGELPYGLFTKIMAPGSNPLDVIMSDYMSLVPLIAGIAVCFVLGILFIIIMPIVGCCMCCCRCCCGTCGGKKLQRKNSKDTCKRVYFSISLFCLTLLMMVGTICTYLTNEKISDAVKGTAETVDNNLDDIPIFLNNTVQQINYVALDNFNFTLDVIDRDLDNIGYLVGVPVRDELATNGGVDAAINSIIVMERDSIIPVANALNSLDSSITDIKTAGTTLTTELNTLKTDVDDARKPADGCLPVTTCNNLDTSVLAMDVDFNNLPDISGTITTMNSVRSKNLTALALEGKDEFMKIPEKVQNETGSVVSSIKSTLHGIPGTINNALSGLTTLPNTVIGPINSFKPQINTYMSYATDYNQYRWYGFMGLTGLIGVIVLMMLLGLACGVFGTHRDALPTERGCLSNTGGNCLLAATGFMFIFSSILMLLTSLTFIIGAPMEKMICQPLKDPDFKIFKEIIDKPDGPLGAGYFLGGMLLGNNTINLTISGILSGCKEGQAAYEALKLGHMFDLSTVLDYKKQIDFNSQLDAINVDLSSIKILSTDTESKLNDFKSASTSVNFPGFKTELAKDTTKIDLNAFATQLDNLAATSNNPSKSKLTTQANQARSIQSGSVANVNTKKAQLLTDVNNLETAMSTVPTNVDKTIQDGKKVDNFLANNGSQLVKAEAQNYANRMLNTADQFADNTLKALQNDIGKCTPVWNIWFSVVHKILCSYFIGSINAFWFSLGWCTFFFIPSIIFSVKLSRYFRRMKYLEGYDDPSDLPMKDMGNGGGKPPVFANNKVKPI